MTISTNHDEICLELHGQEQLWSMRAKINVPKDCIKDVRFEPKFADWRRWEVRMPGTHAPRLVMAGSYWTEEGWDFLYIRRPNKGVFKPEVENVLVIETDQNRYRRVIVSATTEEADKIKKWMKKKK